ncbi:DUF4179 domain-containing protein [Paenibacillus ginsengarvi]|uniref:DUF4179 domain-containing protein n=1 Tax=Paenibacillus ginsengarvi TaxID=400777 RepID=A0A3B0AWT5_9BACL|nr:DUF4179 domain-containing protein [Paenibacillus ginsengarvi]RKN64581.1 DUF4179 domain-containing protein [Paenibacillus ginsengarvi]
MEDRKSMNLEANADQTKPSAEPTKEPASDRDFDFGNDECLQSLKEAYRYDPVPERIDDFIRSGMRKGKELRRRHYRKVGWAAALIVVMLLASARFSTSIEAYVGKLPILQFLAQALHRDAGIETAVENDYMQHIGKSVEHDGIQVTINDIIIDEARMIAFYTVTDKVGYKQINNVRADWIDADTGEVVDGGRTLGEIEPPWVAKGNQLNGNMQYLLRENASIPQRLTLKVQMEGQKQDEAVLWPLKPEWKFTFRIDKEKFALQKKIFDINQTVTLEGQKVTFLRATMLPTVTKLELVIDPHNTKQIFAIEDLRLMDETGNEWKALEYYVSSFSHSYADVWSDQAYTGELGLPPNPVTLYFEGNYLAQAKSLEIVGSSIRALDKDKLDVLVDLDQQKLLKTPDDRLKLKSAKLYPELLEIILQTPKQQSPITSFEGVRLMRVSTPEEYRLKLSSFAGGCGSTYPDLSDTEDTCFRTKFKDVDLRQYLENPLRFRIYDYGYNKIQQPFRVSIF